jgi:uncharacterized protein YndB with AHSA1/START domain
MNTAGALSVTTPNDREIVIVRAFDAPRALVFDCMTKPELIRRWMLGPDGWTMPVCEMDLTVGGAYRYVWRNAEGQEMGMGGRNLEIDPPSRLVSTEKFDGDESDGETLVTALLTEAGGRTTLTTTVRYPSTQTRDAMLNSGMAEGMEAGYGRLETVLGELAQ